MKLLLKRKLKRLTSFLVRRFLVQDDLQVGIRKTKVTSLYLNLLPFDKLRYVNFYSLKIRS